MKKKPKVIQKYSESDIVGVIYNNFESLQSPEGSNFKCYQVLNDTMMLTIANQNFIITVVEREKTN